MRSSSSFDEGTATQQRRHVDRFQQRFLGQDHALLGRAADPDAEQPRRTPPGAERLDRGHHPIGHRGGGREVGEAGLVLGPAPLGGHRHGHAVARYQLGMDHGRRIVARVATVAQRVSDHGGAQRIVGVGIGAADAVVHELLQGPSAVDPRPHADLDEGIDHARILADRTTAEGRHAGVDEDLADRIPGGRTGLVGMRRRQAP